MNRKRSIEDGRRVAIYARVSTSDKGQNPKTQFGQLRTYAKNRDFVVAHELVDYASGTKEDRTNYRKLFGLARKRAVDVVLGPARDTCKNLR